MTATVGTAPGEAPWRRVFALAWPLTAKAMLVHGIVVVDAWLVAPLGESALAALGLAGAVAGLLLGTLLAFSTGTQIRIAQAFGTADPVFLKSALHAGLAINLAVAALGLASLAAAGPPLLDAMAHDAEIAAAARGYLAVFSGVVVAEAVGLCLSSWANGCGDTRLPLLGHLIALPVNVLASVAFIHGHLGMPALGVVGAAVGSVVASLVHALFLGLCLLRRTGAYRNVPGWRGERFAVALRRHLAFVAPIAATFVSASVALHVCTLLSARLDVHAFAALALLLPWIPVVGTVGMSWSQATGILVAQYLGRDLRGAELDRFLGSAWRGAFVAAAIVAGVYVAICALAPLIYTALDRRTLETFTGFWPLLLLLPFPKGSNAICGNTLRAAGKTVYVMHVFVWSQWGFRVPATAFVVLVLEAPAFWVVALLVVEELIKLPPFHLRLFRGDWKRANVNT